MKTITTSDVQDWLVTYVARELSVPPERVSLDEEFVNLGLSSRQAITLTADLEDYVERVTDPALLWDFRTIRQLAEHLGGDAPRLS